MPWRSNRAVDDATWEEWQRRFGESDRIVGFDIARDFEPFSQMNDIFTRAFWDPVVKSKDTEAFFASYRVAPVARGSDGFSQRDFALRNASCIVSDIVSKRGGAEGLREGFQAYIRADTSVAAEKVALGQPEVEAASLKRIARLLGADLVGITETDERWNYTHRPDTRGMTPVPNDLPAGLTHVIVMAHAMDFDLVETYPSALAGASTGREYSHEAATCVQLAAFIRGLGHRAVASMNDTALVIPYAIKAGLGEHGRNQMVLTPEFGPRVRFSKVFTDLPLAIDAPRKLGLAAYCHLCSKCAEACPPKALPKGPTDFGLISPSTIRGVKKWSADCKACFAYWAKIRTDCAICMRVCPFNRRYLGLVDRLWRRLATGRGRRMALWWEARRGRRARLRPSEWWAARDPGRGGKDA